MGQAAMTKSPQRGGSHRQPDTGPAGVGQGREGFQRTGNGERWQRQPTQEPARVKDEKTLRQLKITGLRGKCS